MMTFAPSILTLGMDGRIMIHELRTAIIHIMLLSSIMARGERLTSIEVVGGNQLHGEIPIQGSKNAVLPIMVAAILNKGTTVIDNCPKIL